MLPSTRNLFVYSDIIHVEQIKGKMWINEWDGNNPPMILDSGISRKRSRKAHSKIGNFLPSIRDLFFYFASDVAYVNEMDFKMWKNELDGINLLQPFVLVMLRKELSRRVHAEIRKKLPIARNLYVYVTKPKFVCQDRSFVCSGALIFGTGCSYDWAISRKKQNRAVHARNGNSTNITEVDSECSVSGLMTVFSSPSGNISISTDSITRNTTEREDHI